VAVLRDQKKNIPEDGILYGKCCRIFLFLSINSGPEFQGHFLIFMMQMLMASDARVPRSARGTITVGYELCLLRTVL
jgi:hypothetical protein